MPDLSQSDSVAVAARDERGRQQMEMTSVSDGRTHLVGASDFDAGVWHGQGRYRAMCGSDVVAAPLISGPGLRCQDCPDLTPETRHGTAARLITGLATLFGLARHCGRHCDADPPRSANEGTTHQPSRSCGSQSALRAAKGTEMQMIDSLTSSTNEIRGVLAAVGDQFPQADPSQTRSVPGPARTRLGVFGLRFAQNVGTPSDGGLPPSVICPVRQIAVDPDTGESWRTLLPRAGSMKTTGPSPDGQGSTGNEEWTPDFAGDMA